jgi:N6-L-threonylcarbamoyladenine synthase
LGVGGGGANTRPRDRMTEAGEAAGLEVLYPPPDLCTDNAAMIAGVGAARLARGERSSLDIPADPNLRLTS